MTAAGEQLFEQLMRFKPDALTPNAWAVRAGVSRTIWSDLRRHGNPSRRTLEKLLAAVGSSLAEFEALRVAAVPVVEPASTPAARESMAGWRGMALPQIPLIEALPDGEWDRAGSGIPLIDLQPAKVVGQILRPASMATDLKAYALTMPGDAMWPRFRPGRRLLVSPLAPISAGDDVLVKLAEGRVVIAELVRQSRTFIELRQFSPNLTYRVETADLASVHKVVGEAI